MPIGIFLYEIDESFGPNLLAEYSVKEIGITKEILKILGEKHLKKLGPKYITYRKDDFKYCSSEIKFDEKKLLYLGFILNPEDFIDSLLAVFDEIEENILNNFTNDKEKLKVLLKEILQARIESKEKLKEPKLIKEKINERTKDLLDEGKIQEARTLIDLGETVPDEMAYSVKLAQDSFNSMEYKNAKKHYMKAAELAEKIGELELNKVLNEKAKTAANFPTYLKERYEAYKNINKLLKDIDIKKNDYYQKAIKFIKKALEISDIIEEDSIISDLEELINLCEINSSLSEELKQKDKLIKEILKKLI